jgi:hypothetical protein
MPVIISATPTVFYSIDSGTAINRHINRIGVVGVESRGLDHPAIEVNASIVGEREECLGLHVVCGHFSFKG